MRPGSTYFPLASISAVRASPAGRWPLPLRMATGSSATICVIVLPSTTMSNGPRAGVPLPSATIALRMMSRVGRVPLTTVVCAAAAAVHARNSARNVRIAGIIPQLHLGHEHDVRFGCARVHDPRRTFLRLVGYTGRRRCRARDVDDVQRVRARHGAGFGIEG